MHLSEGLSKDYQPLSSRTLSCGPEDLCRVLYGCFFGGGGTIPWILRVCSVYVLGVQYLVFLLMEFAKEGETN